MPASPPHSDRFARPHEPLLVGLLVGAGLFVVACTSDSTSEPSRTAATASTAQAASPVPDSTRLPSSSAATSDRTLAQRLDDARLEARVTQALVQQRRLRVFDLRPAATDGRVTLRGNVNTADQYRTAERTARRVDGVVAVTNELTIGGRPVTEKRLAALSNDETEEDDAAAVYHTVQRGESLWAIARQYGASVQRLRSLNGLGSDDLQPGQRIRVR